MDTVVPNDFPKSAHAEVENRIAGHITHLGIDAASVPGFAGYAGGWNGLIMRFRAADEEGITASASLAKHQGSLSQEERYLQERALFGFVTNAMSAVESCCFAIYGLCRMAQPAVFTAPDDKVGVKVAAAAVGAAFPGTPLDAELSALRVDAAWRDLKKIRNTLVHGESPGVTVYLSTVGAPPTPPPEWTGRGVVLEPALVDVPRAWLGTTITRAVGATLEFVVDNLN